MEQFWADRATVRSAVSTGRPAGAARYIGRVGAMAVALGIGAAVANGMGIAVADDSGVNDPGGAASESTTPRGSTAADSASGVRVAKPRPPRIRNNSPRSRTDAEEDRPSPAADKPARLRERPAATPAVLDPDSADEDATPTTRNGRGSRYNHRVAESGVSAPARRENAAVVTTTRSGAGVQDQTSAPRRPSGAADDKPIARTAETLRPDSTLNRSTTQLISPTTEATTAKQANPVTAVSRLLTAVGLATPFGARPGDVPAAPDVLTLGLLGAIRREIDREVLSAPTGVAPGAVTARSLSLSESSTAPSALAAVAAEPQPGDTTATVYGDIGKWMLKSNGDIANWGGAKYQDKGLIEPVNVIIIDPTSTTPEESIQKLNAAMGASGFPARSPHSNGYYGVIDGITYSQQPSGILQAYADNVGLTDHGRMFGPAPAADGQGHVWTGAFSTQTATHGYSSFDSASAELAQQLVNSGAATRLDDVYLDNAVNSATQTTGDHTGYAVVLQLNASIPNQPPNVTVYLNKPSSGTGNVTGRIRAVDPERDKLTYTGTTTTDKGTVTVSSTGSFTYTPTPTARHNAAATNATDEQKMDAFNLIVTDAAGNTTVVPVTVAVLGKNAAPSARATVGKADPLGGNVTGSIAVTDTDNDGVTYSHTDPASGSVTINPDGTFTYSPTDAARQQARARNAFGADTFAVTVDDGHGGVKTITVRTSIAPTDQAPVTGTLDLGAPAPTNGAVRGALTASDPDGDTYSFSGSTKTAKGTATVSSRGTFTYTPTAAARAAAASGGDTTDTFTITVKDKWGATATRTVTVPILGA